MKTFSTTVPLALITGGSSGMGLEYARQLADKGFNLLLVSNREEELACAKKELEERIGDDAHVLDEGRGPRVRTRFQDLALPHAADELFAWCQAENLIPDLLINNAGIFFFKELAPDDLPRAETLLNLHIQTVTRLCILFGNAMKGRGSGHILNVSSMAARLPYPGITLYSASKAYLLSFGKSYYHELRPYGVNLTTVCPAAIATPLYNLNEKWMRRGVAIGLIHTTKWLVRRALRATFRGRRIVSPSLMNLYLPPLLGILPKSCINLIWRKIIHKKESPWTK
ncbi:MAG: SDR family NAD(P)-dependent oxidoreductase [Bacteroidales bacterium]|nr:SDR family NAD(P)-dependent oxidoreductase [Bacteroidales bacterium]